MNMWDVVKKILFSAGIEKEEYLKIKPLILDNNRINMLVYTVITAIIMTLMIIASYFDPYQVQNRVVYLGVALISLLLFFINIRNYKKHPAIIFVSVYIYVLSLFFFGIDLGTFIKPDTVSVSFPVLLFAVPLLFVDIPIRMNGAILIGMAGYLVCAWVTQDSVMFGYNRSNVLPYGVLSLIVSTYMMMIKSERFAFELKTEYLSETDSLTGLQNRRRCEQHLRTLNDQGMPDDMRIVVLDINGLKEVNDHLGHVAGDELICGAADCIADVFGKYGHCYRTGGDEFAVIIEGEAPSSEKFVEQIEQKTQCWKGNRVLCLSVSVGIVSKRPEESVTELIQRADEAMYTYKEDYYCRTGLDRRHGTLGMKICREEADSLLHTDSSQ